MQSPRSITLFFLLAGFGLAPLGWCQEKKSASEVIEPSAQAKALAKSREEIHQFFDQYKQATTAEDGAKMIDLYDVDRMVDEIVLQAGIDWPDQQRQQMVQVMRPRLQQQIQVANSPWYRHSIGKIDFLDGDNDAEVFIRVWSEDQTTGRQLVSVHRTKAGWRIYDIADLSMGIRYTTMGAAGMQQAMNGKIQANEVKALQAVINAIMLLNQEDVAGAEEALDGLRGRPAPEIFESMRWFIESVVAIHNGDGMATLECIDKAAAFHPKFPMVDFVRAHAYNQLLRPQKALEHAKSFLEQFGDDADAYAELADAYQALGQDAKAIETLEIALADTPNSLANIEQLALLLPDDRKQEVLPYFRQLRDTSAGFQYLADSMEILGDGLVLNVFVEEMQKLNPDEPLLDYYQAVLMSLNEQHNEAYEYLKGLLSKMDTDHEYRVYYTDLQRTEAIAADRVIDFYRDAEDSQATCHQLVYDLLNEDKDEPAESLLQMHLNEFPKDAKAHVLAGDLDYRQERFQDADQHYQEAWTYQPEGALRGEVIYSRAACWHQQGKAIEGYQQIEPHEEAFEELASLLYSTDQYDTLLKLVTAHQQNEPKSISAFHYQVRVQFERERYAEVIEIAERAFKTPPPRDDDDEWSDLSLLQEKWLRSLIREGKFEQARSVAEKFEEASREFYLALAAAAARDKEQFLQHWTQCISKHGFGANDLHYDVDFPDEMSTEIAPLDLGNLRSVVLLLDEPASVDSGSLTDAAKQAWNQWLFDKRLDDLGPDDDHYVCALSHDAAILGLDGHRFFVKAGEGPFLGDADRLAEEHPEESRSAIKSHRAWLSVESDVWPMVDEEMPGENRKLVRRRDQLIASLAMALGGDSIQAIEHRDSETIFPFTKSTQTAFAEPDPMSALRLLESADE